MVALVVVASAACDETSTGGVPSPERDATVTMPGPEFPFSPPGVTIPLGGKVLWAGSGITHNVAFGSPDAPPGCPNWSFGDCIRQFNVAGVYSYGCTISGHSSMVGVVTVQ